MSKIRNDGANIMVSCKCDCCNYEWDSVKVGGPKQCPKCKRYDWCKEEPKEEIGEEVKPIISEEVFGPQTQPI